MLVVSECVLVYMEAAASARLVAALTAALPHLTWLNYDPIHPHDAFGAMMLKNLQVLCVCVCVCDRERERERDSPLLAADARV